MSAYPTTDQFAEQTGALFSAKVEGGAAEQGGVAEFELVAVVPGIESPSFERFSLEFLGEAGASLPQGTYALENAALGTHDVFLVPIGREGERTRYEAVFSLSKDGSDGTPKGSEG